jgi:hypothetical protein
MGPRARAALSEAAAFQELVQPLDTVGAGLASRFMEAAPARTPEAKRRNSIAAITAPRRARAGRLMAVVAARCGSVRQSCNSVAARLRVMAAHGQLRAIMAADAARAHHDPAAVAVADGRVAEEAITARVFSISFCKIHFFPRPVRAPPSEFGPSFLGLNS